MPPRRRCTSSARGSGTGPSAAPPSRCATPRPSCSTSTRAAPHHQTISDRFAKWPVKVAELSRFRTSKETTATLAGLADGSIDIVVGTHKLLSKDVQFKRLGLLVIDEEHRFGVRHKEAIKAMRS